MSEGVEYYSRLLCAGELVMLSSGEYSDYTQHGLIRTLRAIDIPTVLHLYGEACPAQQDPQSFDLLTFLAWLVAQGYVREEPSPPWRELHWCGGSIEDWDIRERWL